MPDHEPDSPATIAWKTGSAAVLLCTGTTFLVARLLFDVIEHLQGRPLEGSGLYGVGLLFVYRALPILTLISLSFTIHVSLTRCNTQALGLITALGSFGAMTMSLVLGLAFRELSFLLYLYPAPLLAWATGSAAGWYLGSVIQISLAAWLLGWFDRSSRDGTDASSLERSG